MSLSNKPYHYIQFPIYLFREMLNKPNEAMIKMLCYGLVRFADKFKQNEDIVLNQLFYDFYHDIQKTSGRYLPIEVFELMKKNVESDPDYNGFVDGEFYPDPDDVKYIKEKILNDEHILSLVKDHMRFHNIRNALEIMGYNISVELVIETANEIKNEGQILVSVNTEVLNHYLYQNKNEFELLQFMANSGIRSIFGKRPYYKTNKKLILARMFGYKSHQELLDNEFDKIPIYVKYSKRHHIKKLIDHLKLNWGFVFYSNNIRGYYVGMKNKISLKNLIKIVEENKIKNRMKRMQQQEKATRLEVLKELGY